MGIWLLYEDSKVKYIECSFSIYSWEDFSQWEKMLHMLSPLLLAEA